ncbi:cilia- and flagella-associated protein 53 [Callorhinchus milii]|uniref:Cilia- and flagella-associated protein 53 n=1 Tax=Callorhinchus milii TaxID=7868 RepID=A0A4W3ISE9_CALMI|nr:cilia- and flagella-associated protein 53 [Callorhinchus milii]|eukprot:gi/632976762/ref/XP_007904975.1/ PREDICTED: coiled-coil domain-containing protein 11 [Callorhinchus milii]
MAATCREGQRCREVKGPKPCSVAVKAKAMHKGMQAKIEKQKKLEIALEEALAFEKYQRDGLTRNKLERIEEQKRMRFKINQNFKGIMLEYKASIDDRRDRLRELLETEEEALLKEFVGLGDTVFDRQEKMRERAKFLRDKNEKERQQLVADKRDQQFREQSEELRKMMFHKHQLEVNKDRLVQLEMKKELERKKEEEEDLFAELWKKDQQAKEERLAKEIQEEKTRNLELLAVQQSQMVEANAKRMEARRLIQEEAQLMKELERQKKLEDEQDEIKKAQKQLETRSMLQKSIQMKNKRLAEQQKEEEALDTKINEQMLKEYHDDAEEQKQRKFELQREQHAYRQYLARQVEEQKLQEKEMDQLIEADLQKALAKRLEELKMKKGARDRLLKEVMAARKLQVQQKLEENAKKQEELAEEQDRIAKVVKEMKELNNEREQRVRKINKDLQQDLADQIEYQQRIREAEKVEEQTRADIMKMEEKNYQKKVQDAISQSGVESDKSHPWKKYCKVHKDVEC